MNDIKILSIYFYNELSNLLSIPVYNDIQDGITDNTYCVFFILDGQATKYVYNNLAFNTFDIRVNLWSKQLEFSKLKQIIDYFDGKTGITVTDTENNEEGYINSIIYERQSKLVDNTNSGYYGLQAQFTVKTKPDY